ncbi:MAG TPA: YetF domain-containing protein, partial [Bacteroidia bacterium]|nr:YetF domain-containing protein [Bacteroidia bacterium]
FYSYRNKKFAAFLQGSPVLLVYNGNVLSDHLKKENITLDELEEVMREHGVKNISEINLAVLETDGNISILSENYTKKTTRRRRPHKALMNAN